MKRKTIIKLATVLAFTFALVLVLLPFVQSRAYGSNPIRVTVNGRWVTFPDQQPVLTGNRLFVPVGGVFVEMGFTTHWDPVNRIATLSRSDFVVVIPAGASAFLVNNVMHTPPVPQQMINNRLMLPIGAITAAIGGSSTWDSGNRIAHISVPIGPTATPIPPTPVPTVTPMPPSPIPTPPPGTTASLVHAAPRFERAPIGFADGGNAYMWGVRHVNSIWATGSTTNWSRHNLNRQYAHLTATIGRLDGSGSAARTIRFFGDGRNLGEFVITGEVFQPMTVTIDTRNVNVLEIQIDGPGTNGVAIAVGNPTLTVVGAVPTPTPAPVTPTPVPSPVPLLTTVPRFEESPTGFATGGNADMHGVRYPNSMWGGGWSRHNLAGQFSTISATIGRFDGSGSASRTIRFIGDGRVLATYSVFGEVFIPANITVDVRNVSILTIEIEGPAGGGVTAVLTNIMIH